MCATTVRFPRLDRSTWRLQVDGLVQRELELSLAELRERFEEQTVVATLQCAGNRREGLIAVRDVPDQALLAVARRG